MGGILNLKNMNVKEKLLFSVLSNTVVFFIILILIIPYPDVFFFDVSVFYGIEIITLVIIFILYMIIIFLIMTYYENKTTEEKKKKEKDEGKSDELMERIDFLKNNKMFIPLFGSDVIMAVFAEEVIFRFLLFDLPSRYNPFSFVLFFILSAFVFAFLHLVTYRSFFSFFNALFFGILFNFTYILVGFWIGYIMHLLWDFVVFTTIFLDL